MCIYYTTHSCSTRAPPSLTRVVVVATTGGAKGSFYGYSRTTSWLVCRRRAAAATAYHESRDFYLSSSPNLCKTIHILYCVISFLDSSIRLVFLIPKLSKLQVQRFEKSLRGTVHTATSVDIICFFFFVTRARSLLIFYHRKSGDYLRIAS